VSISFLALRNWMRFGGEHELELRKVAYAVVARDETNPGLSNWRGKTSLLEAIRFALYGVHRHRYEDSWITDGEKEGAVELAFGDLHIARERTRGKTTRLKVARGGTVLAQEDAQECIVKVMGLTREDFEASCYFGQRQLARMVLMAPEERTSIVAGWAGLNRLERAEESNRGKLLQVSKALEELNAAIQVSEQEDRALSEGQSLKEMEAKLDELEVQLKHAEAKLLDTRLAVEACAERERGLAVQREYEELQQAIVLLERQAKPAPDPKHAKQVEQMYLEAQMGHAAQSRRLGQLQQLARGQFDGRCPVAGIQCPATDEINRRTEQNTAAAREVTTQVQQAAEAVQRWMREKNHYEAIRQAADRDHGRLQGMRQRLENLKPAYVATCRAGNVDMTESRETANRALDQAMRLRQEVTVRAEKLATTMARINALRMTRARMRDIANTLGQEQQARREAATILGRQGAQRRLAQGVLKIVQEVANDHVLGACGIGLRVEASWEQQGKGLARTCDACGMPFPDSAKVKECQRCHAPRGPNTVNRLEFQFGRSGGAEDLAGLALQLGASRWLRGRLETRVSNPWTTACIDEPFGHLDEEHRGSVGRHLPGMLKAAGFDQAFVVAHHAAALDTLPGSILITGRGGRSEVRVVT